MTVSFELDGQRFTALNGGPDFTFNESISFEVSCEGQEEVDAFSSKLSADGGEQGPCGWLKDRFGVSWQIIPDPASGAARRPGPGEVAAGHEGNAGDEEDRDRRARTRRRGGLGQGSGRLVRRLVVKADDLGYTEGVSRGIRRARPPVARRMFMPSG